MTVTDGAGAATRIGPPDGTAARPVRRLPPALAAREVTLAPVPAAPEPEGGALLTTVLPALSSLGIVGFAVVSGSALYIALGVLLSLVTLGAAWGTRLMSSRARRRRLADTRRRYSAHLDAAHVELTRSGQRQRRAEAWVHPPPTDWPALPNERLWERRRSDPDFLHVRLGLGRAAPRVSPGLAPASPSVDEEADLRLEADALVAAHAAVDEVPLIVDLQTVRSLAVQGPWSVTRPLLRAIILSAAGAHAPQDLRIVALVGARESAWMELLPHVLAATEDPSVASAWLAARDRRSPHPVRDGPTQLVVIDAGIDVGGPGVTSLVEGFDEDTVVVVLDDTSRGTPIETGALLTVDTDRCVVLRTGTDSARCRVTRPDAVPAEEAALVARRLAHRAVGVRTTGSGPVLLSQLAPEGPGGPVAGDRLRVPLGRTPAGRVVRLDLAEAADGGEGPHGLVVGATGSGKSELLRTLLAGLIASNGPDDLAVVFWDFKGGAAVAPFDNVPHLRGTVTNLEQDTRQITRAGRAVRAELRRRQRLLRDAGVQSLADYHRTSAARPSLPRLLVVVDEFTELLAAEPDLLELFLSIGRLGRSLGVHLLLATQRFDEGRLRGLESHLRYRVCLRTFSPGDSQAVLGSGMAFDLPAAPGSAWLQVDGQATRFDVALADRLPELVGAATRGHTPVPADRSLWPPALPRCVSLPPDTVLAPDRAPAVPFPAVVVGLVDHPDEQRQVPLVLDLGAGHLAVVGGPRAGTSTLLRTMVTALAGAAAPAGLHIYAVDAAGGGLTGLDALPHVAALIDPADAVQADLLTDRLRRMLREPPPRDPPAPTAVVAVDGWQHLRRTHEQLAEALHDLAGSGRGVRLLVAGGSWADFRSGVRERFGRRWELRLADPYESDHGRALGGLLPRDTPGRLLTHDGHEAQVALPMTSTASADACVADFEAGERSLRRRIAARWPERAPAMDDLPTRAQLTEFRRPAAGDTVVLGAADHGTGHGRVVEVSLAREDHLLVVGEAGSGRTTALQAVLQQLDGPEYAVWLVDPRGSSRAWRPRVAGYASTSAQAAAVLTEMAGHLPSREGARQGPRLVLVIDDYDVVGATCSGGFGGLLAPLVDALPRAADIPVSLVIARRSGAVARAGFDTGWQLLTELGAAWLVLSADPRDGPLAGGVHPRRLPPGRGLLVGRGRPPVPVQVAEPGPWSADIPASTGFRQTALFGLHSEDLEGPEV